MICLDINECLNSSLHNCSAEAKEVCVNNNGSYTCDCQQGYSLQSDKCEGILVLSCFSFYRMHKLLILFLQILMSVVETLLFVEIIPCVLILKEAIFAHVLLAINGIMCMTMIAQVC